MTASQASDGALACARGLLAGMYKAERGINSVMITKTITLCRGCRGMADLQTNGLEHRLRETPNHVTQGRSRDINLG